MSCPEASEDETTQVHLSDSLSKMEMVVIDSASSLASAALALLLVVFSEAGMMRLGKLVGNETCEVMVTEGLPLTVAVVAPS